MKVIKPFIEKRVTALGIMTLVAIAGLVLRVRCLAGRELWGDELLQLKDLKRPFLDLVLLRPPVVKEGFVGDFVLCWPMAQMTVNKWVLCFPHLVMSVVSLCLLLWIAQEQLRSLPGRLAALMLFVFNRNAIFHALELRPYAGLIFIPLVLMWVLPRLFQCVPTPRTVILWAFAMILIILYHAYGVLILASFFAYYFTENRRFLHVNTAANRWAIVTIIMSLAVLPLWLFYARGLTQFGTFGQDPYQYLKKTPVGIVSFIFGNIGDLSLHGLWTIPLAIVGIGFLISGPERWSRARCFLLLIAFPVILISVADIQHGYFWVPRQFVWVVAPWGLLVGQSLDAMINYFWTDKKQST